MNNGQRICLLRLSALGDLVLLVPLIRTLRHAFPNSKITLITTPLGYSLLSELDIEFIVINKPRSISDYWQIKKSLQPLTFDVLLATQASWRVHLIYLFINAKVKIGFDKQRSKDAHQLFINQMIQPAREHLLEGFLSFAKALGVQQLIYDSSLSVEPTAQAWAEQHLPAKPFLAISLVASKPERSWLIDRYQEVIQQVQQRWAVDIVIIGSASQKEQQLATTLCQATGIHNFVGKTTLPQLAALLKKATALLAPDTGPVHLAVAMNTPVIGLYAVAPPELSRPYHYPTLVVNKYPEAVRTILQQDPQQVPWGTRVHHQAAMALIEVDEVMAKLALVLNQQD